MMKIYLDDIRPAPDGWELVKSGPEFIAKIQQAVKDGVTIRAIAFDHDLAEDHYYIWKGYGDPPSSNMTGYDVVEWLVENHPDVVKLLELIIIHTMNPYGGDRIRDAFLDFYTSIEGQPPQMLRLPGWSR
jgi:hypothetical protein